MIGQIMQSMRKIWSLYANLAGFLLMIIGGVMLLLLVSGSVNQKQFTRAVNAFRAQQEKEKTAKKKQKTEMKPQSEYAQELMDSIESRNNALDQREERLDQRSNELDKRSDRLDERFQEISNREEALDQKKKQFRERKKKWRIDLSDEHMAEIRQAISEASDPFENPEEALQLLYQYVTSEDEEKPDYQRAYKMIRSLNEDDRTTLLTTLSTTQQENLIDLRQELFNRYGSLEEEVEE